MNQATAPAKPSTIGATIAEQLGAMTLRMLGAKNLLTDATGLRFKIMGSAKVTHVHIELDLGTDTYTVEFHKVRGVDVRQVGSVSMVHAEDLHRVIQTHTGLYTRL